MGTKGKSKRIDVQFTVFNPNSQELVDDQKNEWGDAIVKQGRYIPSERKGQAWFSRLVFWAVANGYYMVIESGDEDNG